MSKITVQALVATTPRHLITQGGVAITSFRIASSDRRFDSATNTWIDGSTNWYTLTCFNQLAINVYESIHKGDRVVVCGDLLVRDWDNGERAGTSVEINADTVAHDLAWGTSIYTRTVTVREAGEAVPGVAPVSAPVADEVTHSCNCRNCDSR